MDSFLEFITSYLSYRKQKVIIQNQKSIEKGMEIEVPQGTIPLHFIFSLDDVLFDIQINTVLSNSDDTVVISGANTWSSNRRKMNSLFLLDKIANWLVQSMISNTD